MRFRLKQWYAMVAGAISHHPSVDLLAALVGAIALVGVTSFAPLSKAQQSLRSETYAVLTTAGATLLGLVATAMVLIRSAGSGARIRRLNQVRGKELSVGMAASLRGLGAATALSFLCLISDSQATVPIWIETVAYFAVLLGAARVARALWLTTLIISLDDADNSFRPPDDGVHTFTPRKTSAA